MHLPFCWTLSYEVGLPSLTPLESGSYRTQRMLVLPTQPLTLVPTRRVVLFARQILFLPHQLVNPLRRVRFFGNTPYLALDQVDRKNESIRSRTSLYPTLPPLV